MKKIFFFTLFIGAAALYSSCTKDKAIEPDPTAGLQKLASGYAAGSGARVELYARESLVNTGYTRFYIALYDSANSARLEDAHIQLTPMMDMGGGMMHSAPVENPESEEAVNHLYPCSVAFVMPGNWTLNVHVHNHAANKSGDLVIPLTITDPARSRMKSFTASHNGVKYFVALVEPAAPKVGINDMELAIYKKASMMNWPADSSLSVVLTPEMPTMGHGSPNNVNPVHMGNGHYKGKVNFTMTGYWKLNLDYWSGAAVADTTQYFDLEF